MIALTGWSMHVPGLGSDTDLLGWVPPTSCSPANARELLGRKGLLGKEPATLLALCAVHRALGLPPGSGPRGRDQSLDTGTAVVVSSNCGNLATVCAVTRAAYGGRLRDVSPLDAPNLSSNVIAGSVAIRFGFAGPNLTVCSGETSGSDALAIAARLIRTGRCRRTVVVGVEPRDDITDALLKPTRQLFGGAASVVLEAANGGISMGPVTACRSPQIGAADAVLAAPDAPVRGGVLVIDEHLGATYGARGVVLGAVAGQAVDAGRADSVQVIDGGAAYGYRSFTVRAGAGR
ncbi:beta-ketoacyl synthase N-terminal-like domain-containing protein [Kribbella sp. NPDC050820]|uniref:beta-ketoacyl synthase N-terminal-like domain-containing protein n=1 Tax=Kribbella sp. NPDC050820 TaxID=3155408 RepID=UPI0033E4CA4A